MPWLSDSIKMVHFGRYGGWMSLTSPGGRRRTCQWNFSCIGGETTSRVSPNPPPNQLELLLVVCDDVTPPPIQSGRAGRRQQTTFSLKTLSPGTSVTAFCQHDNHISPPTFMGQPLPPPASTGRFSPTPKSMLGDDDLTR